MELLSVTIYTIKKFSKDLWVRYGLTLINNFNNLIFSAPKASQLALNPKL